MSASKTKYVEVDVDIEEEDVIDYLQDCTRPEILKILRMVKNANSVDIDQEIPLIPSETITDILKIELFAEAVKKYTLTELEEKLK